jgi:hypothetical protein
MMIASGGNFSTEIDEWELGHRVASTLDEESCWGAATMLFWYTTTYEDLVPGDGGDWDYGLDYL